MKFLEGLYLLLLLKLQFDTRFDAIAGILIGLLESEFHQLLVIHSREVPTDENDYVCQNLNIDRHKKEQ